jgi:hypothetical protein
MRSDQETNTTQVMRSHCGRKDYSYYINSARGETE